MTGLYIDFLLTENQFIGFAGKTTCANAFACGVIKAKDTSRIKELDDLLRMYIYYTEGKPIADKLNSIRFKGRREAFKAEQDEALRKLYMAQRKLKSYFTPEGKLPITKWRKELAALKQKQQEIENEMRPLYAEVKELWKIRHMAQQTLDKQQRAAQKKTKGHEIE